MKRIIGLFKISALIAAMLFGRQTLLHAADMTNLMNANVDDSLNASTKKKVHRRKHVEGSNEPGYVNDQLLDDEEEKEEDHASAASGEVSRHKLRFTVMPSYLTIEGTQISNGSRGVLNSHLYPSFKLDYIYRTQNWLFSFITGYKEIVFENSDDRIVMTPKHRIIRNDISAGRIFGHVIVGAGLGLEDKFFYKVVNTSFADVETRSDKKIYGYIDYNFFRHSTYTASINAKVGMNPKENTDVYDIQAGIFYAGSLKIDNAIAGNKKIGLELFFKNEDYKTQQLHLKSSEIGIGLNFSCDWGAGR